MEGRLHGWHVIRFVNPGKQEGSILLMSGNLIWLCWENGFGT